MTENRLEVGVVFMHKLFCLYIKDAAMSINFSYQCLEPWF